MKFDVYFPFRNKAGVLCPGIKPRKMSWSEIEAMIGTKEQQELIRKVRETEGKEREEAKKSLPAVCYTGSTETTRAANKVKPTGLVMIDIDHVEDVPQAVIDLGKRLTEKKSLIKLHLWHITPSGKGLRVVFQAKDEFKTLGENMSWFADEFHIEDFGKFDAQCKDFSRLSFLPQAQDVLFVSDEFRVESIVFKHNLSNEFFEEAGKPAEGQLFSEEETIANFTDEEIREYSTYEYRGTLLKTIIDKWVEVKGAPGKGEIHNYYNEMVKYFRNICSNNKRALLYLLPRFGHSASECWSSIRSICKVNSLSTLPKPFYFFLKDNGFYRTDIVPQGSLAEYMMSDEEQVQPADLPWLPPVFREWIRITPKDFRPSVVNALIPVLGTLTSYLQAPYYFDGRMHTTSFFSIIYAPAGTGKGFVERIINMMFEQLKIRDYIQQARENIYMQTIARKGANEKAPQNPHITLRIIPPKNSEAEFLEKMKDNQGYHMFTYAAEMDSWAKGVRAAGGNKDDMIRIAWDNGEYGQQFKSANTFKGTVQLYWNLLITGTIQQLMAYFKNVENGLITRCSFTTIENQEFASAPIWKAMNKKDLDVIKRFMKRCDDNTYEEPCELMPEDVDTVSADRFDEQIKWRFNFRKRKTINMEWLRPTIEDFLNDQCRKAAADVDKARDVFRRRVAVRGFRLGMLCYALWDKPRESDLRKCIPFIQWWMEQDIEGSLKLWGARYNNEVEDGISMPRRNLYNDLPEAFTKNDVYVRCVKLGIKTPIRNVIYLWVKNGYCKKIANGEYEKINVKKT